MSIKSSIDSGRRLMATTFLDVATIEDKVLVSDGFGGQLPDFSPRDAETPCRFSKLTDGEAQIVADQPYAPAWGSVVLPIGTEVAEGSRIRQPSGRLWEVFANLTPPGNAAVSVRVLVREV